MSEVQCKAVMEQKGAKGKQCWRPPQDNGYCGIHQKQALAEIEKSKGKKKCKTYRCIQYIDESYDELYCTLCIENKNNTEKKLCKATIDQGPNKGKQCSKKSLQNYEYCGKHNERYTLIDLAKNENKRVCDDGKRGCKNFTQDNKLLCEECLEKCRDYDNTRYTTRKETDNICITCGIEIENYLIGENEKKIKRCEACYKKMKDVESRRIREERNYNEERKKNINKHYNEYKKGAAVRNIWFELNLDEFKLLVEQPCFYCNTYNENEAMGIDRLYSNLGYCVKNCASCCTICNMMKGDLDPLVFISHIEKISNVKSILYNKIKDKLPSDKDKSLMKDMYRSYIRPNQILAYIKRGEIKEYIEMCIHDKRSQIFIDKMRELDKIKDLSKPKIRDAINIILKTIQ
jgi:hypothetical protein